MTRRTYVGFRTVAFLVLTLAVPAPFVWVMFILSCVSAFEYFLLLDRDTYGD